MNEAVTKEKNTISIATAQRWVQQWRKTNPDNCKAFLIPTFDLTQVLKEMKILVKQPNGSYVLDESNLPDNGVRAYMAIDEELVKEPGKGEKLVIVGTTKEVQKGDAIVHRDIIFGAGATVTAPPVDSGIYDFTTPCPPECDPVSPLN